MNKWIWNPTAKFHTLELTPGIKMRVYEPFKNDQHHDVHLDVNGTAVIHGRVPRSHTRLVLFHAAQWGQERLLMALSGLREGMKEVMPKLCLKWNNTTGRDVCAICHERYEATLGIQTFLKGTWGPVCEACKQLYEFDQEGEVSLEDLQKIEDEFNRREAEGSPLEDATLLLLATAGEATRKASKEAREMRDKQLAMGHKVNEFRDGMWIQRSPDGSEKILGPAGTELHLND